MRKEFAGENMFESIVVANSRERRGVGMQGECTQRFALAQEAACEFRRNVLRVGGRAPVACDEQLTSGSQGGTDEVDGTGNRRRKTGKSLDHFLVLAPDRLNFFYLFSRTLHDHLPLDLIFLASTHSIGWLNGDSDSSLRPIHCLVPSPGQRSPQLWKRHLNPFGSPKSKDWLHPGIFPA